MKNNFSVYYSNEGSLIWSGYFKSGDIMAKGGKTDNDELWDLLEYVSKYFSDFSKVKRYLKKLSKEIERGDYRPIFGYTNGTFFSPIVDKASYWLYDNFDDIKNNERRKVLSKVESWRKEYILKQFQSFGKYEDEKFRPYFLTRYEIHARFHYKYEQRDFRNAEQIFKIAKRLFEESSLSRDYDLSYYAPADYININIVKKEKMAGGGEAGGGNIGLDILDKKKRRLADKSYYGQYFKGILKQDLKKYLKKGDAVYFKPRITPYHGTRIGFYLYNEYTSTDWYFDIMKIYNYVEDVEKASEEEAQRVYEEHTKRDFDTYSID